MASIAYATVEQTHAALADFWKTFFRMVHVETPVKESGPETKSTIEPAETTNIVANPPVGNDAKGNDSIESAIAKTEQPEHVQKPPDFAEESSAQLSPLKWCRMVADLSKCSSRLALLLLKEVQSTGTKNWFVLVPSEKERQQDQPPLVFRSIVRFPNENDARAMTKENPTERLKRPSTRKPSNCFGSASQAARQLTVAIRTKVSTSEDEKVEFARLDPTQRVDDILIEPPQFYEEPPLEILRTFAVQPQSENADEDEIMQELKRMQKEVEHLEREVVEPKARKLMDNVVKERLDFEQSDAIQQADEEKKIHAMFRKMQANRKAIVLEKQKQLEQDMDAVCSICDDGEVTPDNQILFCDTCDVAVHQMCYGIETIPAGDYHCLACRFLGRDKEGRDKYLNKNKRTVKVLPISCEICICPQKPGAFVRTDMKPAEGEQVDPNGKWVHVVCAKWQGLNFVNNNPELIEDITEIRGSFRTQKLKCELCLGARGCLNQCREPNCKRFFHVTCARAVGNCEVTHGEDCKGEVEENPWTLKCPEHSDASKVPKNQRNEDGTRLKSFMTAEKLIELAKSLPPEPVPKPKPQPVEMIPFNKANFEEQKLLLQNKKYEKALIHELVMNRSAGVRCEVCDVAPEAGQLVRCNTCRESICRDCIMPTDTVSENGKCLKCKFASSGTEEPTPKCTACNCPHGHLRACSAKPVSKYKGSKQEFGRSLFTTARWIHSLCGLWNPKVFLSRDPENPGHLDLKNVVMAHGKGFIDHTHPCFLCGMKWGLKVRCDHAKCCWKNEQGRDVPTAFHVTCARNAGLEVRDTEGKNEEGLCVKCYRHGGNEFNIRAKLEDLFEVEKLRKKPKSDPRLKFPDAAKMMNAAIPVIRILGWAWRWAEWWVDYDQTWEPLLEPGQKEKDMTKEELRIVESTRESRCSDARKCRLIALGAAFRDRLYDDGDDFNREALDKALRAFLNTKSLVGPLDEEEIEFHAEWLGRAYRSKSRLLFLDKDKIPVASEGFCVDKKKKASKYAIDRTKIPGLRKLEDGMIFEPLAENDVDDFLQTEVMEDAKGERVRKRNRKRNRNVFESAPPASTTKLTPERRGPGRPPREQAGASSAVKRGRGRPPKRQRVLTEDDAQESKQNSSARLERKTTSSSDLIASRKRRPEREKIAILADVAIEPKRGRGRPPTKKPAHVDSVSSLEEIDTTDELETTEQRRRPGRPPRSQKPSEAPDVVLPSKETAVSNQVESELSKRPSRELSALAQSSPEKRRGPGRPPRKKGQGKVSLVTAAAKNMKDTSDGAITSPKKRGRGRPPRALKEDPSSETKAAADAEYYRQFDPTRRGPSRRNLNPPEEAETGNSRTNGKVGAVAEGALGETSGLPREHTLGNSVIVKAEDGAASRRETQPSLKESAFAKESHADRKQSTSQLERGELLSETNPSQNNKVSEQEGVKQGVLVAKQTSGSMNTMIVENLDSSNASTQVRRDNQTNEKSTALNDEVLPDVMANNVAESEAGIRASRNKGNGANEEAVNQVPRNSTTEHYGANDTLVDAKLINSGILGDDDDGGFGFADLNESEKSDSEISPNHFEHFEPENEFDIDANASNLREERSSTHRRRRSTRNSVQPPLDTGSKRDKARSATRSVDVTQQSKSVRRSTRGKPGIRTIAVAASPKERELKLTSHKRAKQKKQSRGESPTKGGYKLETEDSVQEGKGSEESSSGHFSASEIEEPERSFEAGSRNVRETSARGRNRTKSTIAKKASVNKGPHSKNKGEKRKRLKGANVVLKAQGRKKAKRSLSSGILKSEAAEIADDDIAKGIQLLASGSGQSAQSPVLSNTVVASKKRHRAQPVRYGAGAEAKKDDGRKKKSSAEQNVEQPQRDTESRKADGDESEDGLLAITAVKKRRRTSTDLYPGLVPVADDQRFTDSSEEEEGEGSENEQKKVSTKVKAQPRQSSRGSRSSRRRRTKNES